jgi:hypothetical protein
MQSMSSHIALNSTTGESFGVANTEQDSDALILKRYLLVEFLSTPAQDREPEYVTGEDGIPRPSSLPPARTRDEIRKFCEEAEIPVEHWTRWLRQISFKDEVAGRVKDSIYNGEGAAQAYLTLEAALSDKTLPASERAKIATTIAKLHLKHLEILTKTAISSAKTRNTGATRNTLEAILDELKRNREPKLLEADTIAEAEVTE